MWWWIAIALGLVGFFVLGVFIGAVLVTLNMEKKYREDTENFMLKLLKVAELSASLQEAQHKQFNAAVEARGRMQ